MFKRNNLLKINPKIDFKKSFSYKGKDGKEYSNPEDLEQANKEYYDSMKIDTSSKQFDLIDIDTRHKELDLMKIEELRSQIYSNPEYALNEAGFGFIKTVYEIDPELANELLSVITQALKTGKFEETMLNYKKLVETKFNTPEISNKIK